MNCYDCEFAKRNSYGVFVDMCGGSCSFEKFTGTVGKLIDANELSDLTFGSQIRIEWNNGEQYKGVIFGRLIGYKNDKTDIIKEIADYINIGLCKVYLLKV